MDQLAPYTVQSLGSDLRALGVTAGDTVLAHSSASSLGFVAGGAQAVVQALLDVLGPEGTLVVPTHTPDNTDPADWCNPPVPESWWPAIRSQAPGFDPSRTPSRWMGVIAETVRTWPGSAAQRSPARVLRRARQARRFGHGDASARRRPGRALTAWGGLPARREGPAAGLRARLEHLPAPGRVAAEVAAARASPARPSGGPTAPASGSAGPTSSPTPMTSSRSARPSRSRSGCPSARSATPRRG